ncbi:MAG: prkC 33 [Verrucomicrobiaceae bacterium]|nr:prkC 33 [Verrucomicrobiaceae bacterium]
MDDRFNRKDKPEGQEVIVSHDADGGLVLLHRIALDTSASQEARQALLDTTHASSTFRHPHVLAVREVRLEDGSLVFVQEHPEGPLLADRLKKGGAIPLREALTWMRQFAQGLEAAQSSGLTLSQICPTEFLVQEASPGGLLCLCPPVPTGWWLDVEDAPFASPEQKASQACDIRSTMYSAGAVLAAMLTTQRPEKEAGWAAVLFKAKLPKAVNRALNAVLAVDQAKRCATPADWIALLDQAITSIPSQAVQPAAPEPVKKEAASKKAATFIAGSKPLAPSHVEMGEAVFEAPAEHQNKRGLSPALMAVIAVVLVFGTWMLLPKKESATPTSKPPSAVPEKPSETAAQSPAADDQPVPATQVISAHKEEEPKAVAATSAPSLPPAPAAPIPTEVPSPTPVAKSPAMPPPPPSAPQVVAQPAPVIPPEPAKVETKPVVETQPAAAADKPGMVAATPALEAAAPPPVEAAKPSLPASSAPAPVPVAEAKPNPPPAAAPAVVMAKPQPPSKEELLQQAAQAHGSERTEIYRKVLALDARNPKALHGLVESTLRDLPTEGEKRSEFTGWAKELATLNDPLGTHAIASLALQEAAAAKTPDAAIRIFTAAIAQLKDALHSGDDSSYPVLIQAYIDLHQTHIVNHEKPKADRVSKALQDEIARTPGSIPAQVPADFAANIDALLKERTAKGPPRMQEAFLKTVAQSLRALSAPQKRSEAPAQKRPKSRR